MGITFVRLSAPDYVKEKLETVLQETGKSINEIINAALEKYLIDEYGLTTPQTEADDFSSSEENFNVDDQQDSFNDAEIKNDDEVTDTNTDSDKLA